MKIYSMTATFGKLEHATLDLTDGLNVIEAPNEWGKSTWCAFLVAMLYGIETRTKTTKTALADKEHYLPWSGSPMAGRIDLNWNGRDITIERHTKGRVPMGQFSAYETQSGISIPEMNAQNCGELLLGVERSVFLRSSFVRLTDMPVAQDELLRKRLNALVTTGDESGDAERLATQLHDLKNKCRHNRTGELPQALNERDSLEAKLRELKTLEEQAASLEIRARNASDAIVQLENHQKHLAYAGAQADAERLAAAQSAERSAQARADAAKEACEALPSREDADTALSTLKKLNAEGLTLQEMLHERGAMPERPEPPAVFRGMSADAACETARADAERYQSQKSGHLGIILGATLLILGVIGFFVTPALVALALVGAVVMVLSLVTNANHARARKELEEKYGSADTARWCASAEIWAERDRTAQRAISDAQRAREMLDAKIADWRARVQEQTNGMGIADTERHYASVIATWDEAEVARTELMHAQAHLQTVSSMARRAEKPQNADTLTLTEKETDSALTKARAELAETRSRRNQYEGRMEALGDREGMLAACEKLDARIAKLKDMEEALVIAEQTLADATLALQRRFAPQIAQQAQALMQEFSLGRYERLSLSEDMGLRSAAGEEDTLHDAIWRSDGTTDQLYLALRLAVAQALAPDAPLILDDALVRFDDDRLCAALKVLRSLSQKNQIILFTCQSREQKLLANIIEEETI